MENFYKSNYSLFGFLLIILVFFPFNFYGESLGDDTNNRGTAGGHRVSEETQNEDFDIIKKAFLIEYIVTDGPFPDGSSVFSFNNSKATKALNENCSKNYEDISTILGSTPQPETIAKKFKTEMQKCGQDLFNDYYTNLYLNNLFEPVGRMADSFLRHSTTPPQSITYENSTWKDIKDNSNEIFASTSDFHKNCMSKVKHSHIDGEYSYITANNVHEWERVFVDLQSNSCHTKKGKFNLFITENVRELEDIKTECIQPQPNKCIQYLKQKVKLIRVDTTEGKKEIFFQNCDESYTKAKHCCSEDSPQECNLYDTIKNKYQTAISSQANQNQCSADNSHFQDMKVTMLTDIQTICQKSVEACHTVCDTELNKFKTEFLTCFRLPNWTEAANYWDRVPNNTCKNQIAKIRKAYNDRMKPESKPSLSKDSQGADIKDCDAPKVALENRIRQAKADASQVINDLCKEQAEKLALDSPDNKFNPHKNNKKLKANHESAGYSSAPHIPGQATHGQMDFNPEFGDNSNEDGKNTPLAAAETGAPGTNTNKKTPFSKDMDKFNKDDYERQFNPLLAGGRGKNKDSSSSSALSSAEGASSYDNFEGSDPSAEPGGRSVASLGGANWDSNSGFGIMDGYGASDSLSSQRGYLASLGRKARKSLAEAFKPFRVPTVKSAFNIHGSDISLLEQQRKLFDMFCKSNSCNY